MIPKKSVGSNIYDFPWISIIMATEGYAFKTMIHGKVRNFKNNTKSVICNFFKQFFPIASCINPIVSCEFNALSCH